MQMCMQFSLTIVKLEAGHSWEIYVGICLQLLFAWDIVTLLILCLSGDFKNLFRSTPGPFGLVSPNFGKGHCLASSAGRMFFLQFQFTFLKSSFTLISRNMGPIKNCSAYTRTIFGLFLLEIPACCICSHQGWQWALRTNQKRGPSSDIVDFPINSGVNKLIFLQSTKIKL